MLVQLNKSLNDYYKSIIILRYSTDELIDNRNRLAIIKKVNMFNFQLMIYKLMIGLYDDEEPIKFFNLGLCSNFFVHYINTLKLKQFNNTESIFQNINFANDLNKTSDPWFSKLFYKQMISFNNYENPRFELPEASIFFKKEFNFKDCSLEDDDVDFDIQYKMIDFSSLLGQMIIFRIKYYYLYDDENNGMFLKILKELLEYCNYYPLLIANELSKSLSNFDLFECKLEGFEPKNDNNLLISDLPFLEPQKEKLSKWINGINMKRLQYCFDLNMHLLCCFIKSTYSELLIPGYRSKRSSPIKL